MVIYLPIKAWNCDNEAVVSIINTKHSPISRVIDLMRHLTLLTLKHNMCIRAVHIPGKHNDIADAIFLFLISEVTTIEA